MTLRLWWSTIQRRLSLLCARACAREGSEWTLSTQSPKVKKLNPNPGGPANSGRERFTVHSRSATLLCDIGRDEGGCPPRSCGRVCCFHDHASRGRGRGHSRRRPWRCHAAASAVAHKLRSGCAPPRHKLHDCGCYRALRHSASCPRAHGARMTRQCVQLPACRCLSVSAAT